MPNLRIPRLLLLPAALALMLAASTGLARYVDPELAELIAIHHTAPWPQDPATEADVEPTAASVASAECPALLRHAFVPIQGGAAQSLCGYQGRVLLIVNTASECGYTPQYEGLEALYRKFRDRGLVVIGFPSNDFGGQEPGANKTIEQFCRTIYGVQFPMFEKTSVRGASNPLYADLAARTGAVPRWNFHKYLVDRSGTRVQSFVSDITPDSPELVRAVERWLAETPRSARG